MMTLFISAWCWGKNMYTKFAVPRTMKNHGASGKKWAQKCQDYFLPWICTPGPSGGEFIILKVKDSPSNKFLSLVAVITLWDKLVKVWVNRSQLEYLVRDLNLKKSKAEIDSRLKLRNLFVKTTNQRMRHGELSEITEC